MLEEKNTDSKIHLKCGMPSKSSFIKTILIVGRFVLENFEYKDQINYG